MVKVYIFHENGNILVKSQGKGVEVRFYRNWWYVIEPAELVFEVLYKDIRKVYEILFEGNFVLFEEEILEIKNDYRKVLLVTDIDGTLYHPSEAGTAAYRNFLRFWVTNFQFNGSILVYNTGKPVDEYKSFLYQPDLLITLIGNYAYNFSHQNLPVCANDFREILANYNRSDWDSETINCILRENFDFSEATLVELIEYNILFLVSQDFVEKNLKSLKSLLKNKNNIRIKGLVLHCKVIVSKQQLSEGLFLEIIPSFSGKNNGVFYSLLKFGFSEKDCLIAGDSYNDIDLFKYPVKGVLVNNAEPNIKNWLCKKPRPFKYQSSLNYSEALIEALHQFN